MPRLVGPDESVRLVYTTSGVAKAQGLTGTVYADAGGTVLADILTLGGDDIAGSVVTVDAFSKLPLFQFPDGADTVYITVNGGPLVPLYARADDRLDGLTARVSALEPGGADESATAAELAAHTADTTGVHGIADTAALVTTARTITAGTGLSGGGSLTADRTLSVVYGTTAGTAAQGNDSRITGALAASGGTMTGNLTLNSDASGGTSTDSTRRITLQSYQKATAPSHYGEPIRIDLMADDAKGMIAWRENYTGSGPRSVAWIGAHGKSNDGLSWHNHISIEVPDQTGALQSALEIPFAPWNQVNGYGIPANQVYVRSIVKFVAAAGASVEGPAGTFRGLVFGSTDGTNQGGKSTFQRWSVQADSTAESGSNAGSDFRIARCNDAGTALDAPFFIKRSNGYVGVNTTSPAARLSVDTDGTIEGAFVKATANGTANVAVLRVESAATGKRVFDYRVTGDGVSRLRVDTSAGSGSGTLTFGDGTSADVNLYRGAADVLMTDDTFRIGAAAVLQLGAAGDVSLYRSAADVLSTDDSFTVGANFRHFGAGLGFYSAATVAKQTVTGSRGGNAALASLLTALATVGLITDSTSA